jgi:hypothetical protein
MGGMQDQKARLARTAAETLFAAHTSGVMSLSAMAAIMGRAGGLKGGPARAMALSSRRRSEIAKLAAEKRWSKR